MYEESKSCCCLEDCGLCGEEATPFNLVRRDRKRGGGVSLQLHLITLPLHVGVLTQVCD